MNDPFLIDECLTPDLVALAQARGYHATHVVWRGLGGTQDPDLLPVIRDESFVLVTNNGRDFLGLYAQEGLHPGLIILVPGGLARQHQLHLFGLVLDRIEGMAGLVNTVVEVYADGTVTLRDWPDGAQRHPA